MAAFERTRVRERDPQDANTYERNMRVQLAFRERSLTGKIVLKGSERPLEQSRQGFLQFFNSREAITDTALQAEGVDEVRLGADQSHRLVPLVEVLHGDPFRAQRQVDHVARLPGVAHAVEQSVAASLPDVDHLTALELQPSAPPAGADLL